MIDKSKPIRLIELFAGIGSQAKALKNLGLDFEHHRICEFDKYAVQSYNAVHNTNFQTSDITKISASDLGIENTDKYNYLLTYSFPCQDLSNAGKGAGMEKGSGTRSGLLWEVERLLNECVELPQILLMENVPQVHGKKNIEHFDKWIEFLDSKGYTNFWQDLNAKDYGIPQNRKRCYMVSILGGDSFDFPKGIPLSITLKDVLDVEVEEKYYLSSSKLKMISNWKSFEKPLKKVNGQESISPTLTTRTAADCSSIITYSKELTETTDIEPIVSKSKLKETLCNELLDKGLVDEGDVIMHSYTNNRLNNGIDNMARTESKEKLSPTLTTRPDCLGIVVKENTLSQKDICNKALENNLVKPYDMFDPSYVKSRMEEIEENKLHRMNTSNNQIANTLTAHANNFAVCVPKVIGGVGEKKSNGGTQWYQQDRIYDNKIAIGVTPTATPYYAVQKNEIIDPFIVASRGRNPENPSDRTAGIPTEQRLEPNFSGCSNTLTTVQKDNYVCEPIAQDYQVPLCVPANWITDNKKISPTITAHYYKESVNNFMPNTSSQCKAPCVVVEPKINVVGNYSPSNHDASRIVDTNGIAPTVKENHGTVTAVAEPIINKIDIPQTVRVRKYEVDCEKLCEVLRTYKSSSGLNNQDIASLLNVSLTKVEHWFRQDKSFAIPSEDIWFELKAILGIKTNEFDESIMTFEEKENAFEKANRCYLTDGLAPTITSTTADEKIIESLRIRKLTPKECWRLMGFDDEDFEKAAKVTSNSQLYKQAGNSIVVNVLMAIFKELFKKEV